MALMFLTPSARARLVDDLNGIAAAEAWPPDKHTAAVTEIRELAPMQIPDNAIPGIMPVRFKCGLVFVLQPFDFYLDPDKGKIVAAAPAPVYQFRKGN